MGLSSKTLKAIPVVRELITGKKWGYSEITSATGLSAPTVRKIIRLLSADEVLYRDVEMEYLLENPDLYVVYLIENAKNNKRYVGCCRQGRFSIRISEHLRPLAINKHIGEDVQTLGKISFTYKVLKQDLPKEVAHLVESRLIYELDSQHPKGYNVSPGIDTLKKFIISKEQKIDHIRYLHTIGVRPYAVIASIVGVSVTTVTKYTKDLPNKRKYGPSTRAKMSVARKAYWENKRKTKVGCTDVQPTLFKEGATDG